MVPRNKHQQLLSLFSKMPENHALTFFRTVFWGRGNTSCSLMPPVQISRLNQNKNTSRYCPRRTSRESDSLIRADLTCLFSIFPHHKSLSLIPWKCNYLLRFWESRMEWLPTWLKVGGGGGPGGGGGGGGIGILALLAVGTALSLF